jgi:hypothetical protein
MEIWWLSTFSVTAWVASLLGVFDNEFYVGDEGRWKGAHVCFAIAAVAAAVEWYAFF